jgi:FkbM family methyltransferase
MLKSLPITKIKIFGAKILYRIIVPIFSKREKKIVRNDIHYQVDLSEGIDLSLFIFGNFQKHVSHNKLLEIPKNAVVFDIGGNFGIMALQFAKQVPDGKVISFEPTHYALEKFRQNLTINPALQERIIIVNSFISSKSSNESDIKAFSSWKVSSEKNTEEKHPVHKGTAKSSEGVGSITMDDYCVQSETERIDLIKIDTDGHEFEVFNGAKKSIAKFRPKIVFEVGKYVMIEKGIDFTFYLNYFNDLNYKLLTSKSAKEITSKNYNKLIPEFGTIDVIALPKP